MKELLSKINLKNEWEQLEYHLQLKLPELVELDFNENLDSHLKFLGFRTIKRNLPVTKGTVEDLINWTVSLNFNKIIELDKITSKYEIERIVSGVISNSVGLPINEIKLHQSITNDLGVD